jgi:hypothetical protein
LIRDGDAVIVVHGIDYNFNHVYDFSALGVSDLDKTLPGEATAPALCGSLHQAPSGRSATAANGTTYVASLRTTPPIDSPSQTTPVSAALAGTALSNPGRPGGLTSLLCHLGPPRVPGIA